MRPGALAEWLVFFRILQGLGGGALQPISQAILLESFPLRTRGMGMAIFGIGVVFAPIIGPTLGGWITDNYSWRWIFFINIPVGILALILTQMNVADPPYLPRGVGKIDYMGLGLLAVGIGALQIVLDNGQREDWFETQWILQLAILAAVCLIALIMWELRAKQPIIDLTIFRVRNFAPGITLMFMLGVALYGSLVLLPLFLQNLLGYTATQSGMAMSPGGIGTLICMPFVGFLVGREDPRIMVLFGLVHACDLDVHVLALQPEDQLLARSVSSDGHGCRSRIPVRAARHRDGVVHATGEDRIGHRDLQPDAQYRRQLRHRRGDNHPCAACPVPSGPACARRLHSTTRTISRGSRQRSPG